MTAKELIERLSQVAPDTEIVGGVWNGRVETYTVLDDIHVLRYDAISNDFFGTPGAFDQKLMKIKSKDVVYMSSRFDATNKKALDDRHLIFRLRTVLRQHRSKNWKKEQIFNLLTSFDRKDSKG